MNPVEPNPSSPPPAVRPFGLFIATGGELRVTPNGFCEHGDLAFMARLSGYYPTGDQHAQRLDVVMPRCLLAELFGAALAVVDHTANPEASDRFTNDVNEAHGRILTALRLHIPGNDHEGPRP